MSQRGHFLTFALDQPVRFHPFLLLDVLANVLKYTIFDAILLAKLLSQYISLYIPAYSSSVTSNFRRWFLVVCRIVL